jgi:hypothetical protein
VVELGEIVVEVFGEGRGRETVIWVELEAVGDDGHIGVLAKDSATTIVVW